MEHNAVGGLVEAIHGADRDAGRVRAVHAGYRDGALAVLAVVDGDDAAPVHAPGNLMLVLAGRDAGVALDAAIGVAEEFHTCHFSAPPLTPALRRKAWFCFPARRCTRRSPRSRPCCWPSPRSRVGPRRDKLGSATAWGRTCASQ